jgi:hypothetical protein
LSVLFGLPVESSITSKVLVVGEQQVLRADLDAAAALLVDDHHRVADPHADGGTPSKRVSSTSVRGLVELDWRGRRCRRRSAVALAGGAARLATACCAGRRPPWRRGLRALVVRPRR